jgi:hypothetical protein
MQYLKLKLNIVQTMPEKQTKQMKIKWSEKIYSINIDNTFLNKELLSKYFDKFFNDIVIDIKDTQHIMLISRLIFIDKQYISISKS